MVRAARTGYAIGVKPFLDLVGASGAVYRFRLVGDLGELPATAGNFVYAREEAGNYDVVCCGTARSLFRARAAWPAAVERRQATHLYVRLNVSRAVREGEHEDIIAAANPDLVLTDFD